MNGTGVSGYIKPELGGDQLQMISDIDGVKVGFSETLAKLASEGLDRRAKSVSCLTLDAIKTATVVFQPRDVEYAYLASDQHIKTLTEAIQDAPGHALEALVVWWSGKSWYVIDGHHRLQAYQQAEMKVKLPLIPVMTFDGTLHEAIKQAAALNCRDKLKMSKADKLERAGKLVCLPERWTKASIHLATGISERTVATMRKVRTDRLSEDPEDDLLCMTWVDAKLGERSEIDDGWEERQAIEWHKRLVKTFGTKLADHPEITARAIELYSDRLPAELMPSWRKLALSYADECHLVDVDADF